MKHELKSFPSNTGPALKHFVLTAGLWLAATAASHATTWWVAASAGGTGVGTQASPFNTVAKGVTAALAGDTINVESGTYRETVTISRNNVTLQNYNGQRAVISGMGDLSSTGGTVWATYTGTTKAPAGSVYTTTVGSSGSAWKLRDMYGNYSRDQICRTPASSHPWATISSVTGSGTSYTVTVPTLGISFPSVQSAFVDIFEKAHTNGYLMYYISSITDNGTTCTINLTTDSGGANITVGDTLIVCNHPSLIQGAFDFAYQDIGSGQTQVYVEPGSASNLNHCQASKLVSGIIVTGSGDIINGIEVAGFTNFGISGSNSTNLLVENCLIHDNGFGESFGEPGINIRVGSNPTIKNCLVTQNFAGIGIAQVNGATITQCDVGYNDNDGIDLSGHGNTNPIDIDHCFIHNHSALLHPDDIQFDNDTLGTHLITVDSNFLTCAGQGIMSADLDGVDCTNNVIAGIGARNIIEGSYNNVIDWYIGNNTFAFSMVGAVSGATSGTFTEFEVENSIFFHDIYSFTGQSGSDYNFFWGGSTGSNPEDPVANTNPPFTYYYVDPTGTQKGLSFLNPYEVHSNGGATVFNHTPYFEGQVSSGITSSTTTNVIVDVPAGGAKMTGRWAVGDVVEFDGDGVIHTISASTVTPTSATITFTPALPAVPSRQLLVWDWAPGTTSLALDYSVASGSLALTGSSTGGQRGSNINTLNYQNDIFTGSTRNVPTIPADVHYGTSWLYPYVGIQ